MAGTGGTTAPVVRTGGTVASVVLHNHSLSVAGLFSSCLCGTL